jgi:hypothetical protein
LANETERSKVTPEETGGVLYYLVGSNTDELLNDKENIEKMGLEGADRDDLYIEMSILHMFLIIKQYTKWEKDETKYTKALDQMHFLLFHQLKEYSNYDEDDIEELHSHIFSRYDEYGDAIENNLDGSWVKVLAASFLDNMNDEMDQQGAVIVLAKKMDRFYKSIPNILNSL